MLFLSSSGKSLKNSIVLSSCLMGIQYARFLKFSSELDALSNGHIGFWRIDYSMHFRWNTCQHLVTDRLLVSSSKHIGHCGIS